MLDQAVAFKFICHCPSTLYAGARNDQMIFIQSSLDMTWMSPDSH